MWTRRDWLGGMAIAFAGCHLPDLGSRAPIASSDTVRAWLRDAVRAIGRDDAVASAIQRRRVTAALDGNGQGLVRGHFEGVVIRVGNREEVSGDLSASGIARLVTKGGSASFSFQPVVYAPPLRGDPRVVSDAEILARLGELVGGHSRIIYAANALDIDDVQTWSVGKDHDFEQRVVRIRETATRVAWNGARPVVGSVSRAWQGGLADGGLLGADYDQATRAATELMTPGRFDGGERDLLLDASIVAALVDARPGLDAVETPDQPGAYGGFAFDDAGTRASTGMQPQRRAGGIGRLIAMHGHLRVPNGSGALLKNGYVVEDPRTVSMMGDRVVLEAARAREITGGAATGRVYANVELVGSISALYASATARSQEVQSVGFRDERDGEPLWRSVEAPAVRVRGTLRRIE